MKLKNFLKTGLIDLVVIATGLAYVFFNMVVIKKTDLTVEEMLAKAGFSIFVGFSIKQCLSENGITKGYQSTIWNERLDKYSVACNSANKYMERVDNFYIYEEIEKKKNYRRTNLMGARLKYARFFDKNGDYIEQNINDLSRHQKRILKKCISVKIYPINLFSEYANEIGADTKREKTDNMQRGMMFGKNSLSTIFAALVGAYFIPVLDKWDWAAFVVAFVQVCIWVSAGIIQLYSNYNYITVEKTAKLTRKMELIVKFCKGCDEGKYTTNPYDEEIENEEIKINNVSIIQHDNTDCVSNSKVQTI